MSLDLDQSMNSRLDPESTKPGTLQLARLLGINISVAVA
jgi:hypothetical protein